jgi:hypothetical protein
MSDGASLRCLVSPPCFLGEDEILLPRCSGVLGSDAAQLVGGVPENVTMFNMVRVPRAVFMSHIRVPLASLSMSLGLGALAPSPRWDLG